MDFSNFDKDNKRYAGVVNLLIIVRNPLKRA
jgi:hypothetical protein